MILSVFDCETTSLLLHPKADMASQPKIIEFAACLIDSERAAIVDEYEQLINPLQTITEEITKITGITNAMIQDKPTFPAVAQAIAKFMGRASVMIAHNLEFDETMLKNELERNLIKDFPWPSQGMCTVQLWTSEWGRNMKLTELYERKLGKPLAQTHRALDDVKALCEIVIVERLWELCV